MKLGMITVISTIFEDVKAVFPQVQQGHFAVSASRSVGLKYLSQFFELEHETWHDNSNKHNL